MKRYAAHLDRHARRLPACGQRDVQEARGLLGILEEQLVEIAHAIEQQRLRMLSFQPEVLNHHWRMRLQGFVVSGARRRGHASILAGGLKGSGIQAGSAAVLCDWMTCRSWEKILGLPATRLPDSR